MTLSLRKVALASDSDDSDDVQAMETAGGGDTDAEEDPGIIGGGNADVAVATALVSEGGDADTEDMIAEGSNPAAERQATESAPAAAPPDVTESIDLEPVVADATLPTVVDPVSVTPDPVAADDTVPAAADPVPVDPVAVGPSDTLEPAVEPVPVDPYVAGPDEASPPVDPDSVGFDGRSPVPADADDGAGTGDETPPPGAPAPKSRRIAVAVLSVLTLVVVGAGVGAWLWSRGADDSPTSAPRAQAPGPSATLSEGAFVTFNDPETGTTMRYPRAWKRSAAPVREVRLVVTDGEKYSALVRVARTAEITTPANLANIKAVTDGVVGPGVQILKQDPITVNGLIGYRYIYTFTDKDSGLTSAHLHYFLFQGHKMNSIVFEAIPTDNFDRISGTFDQMLGSFHSDPEPP